MTNDKTFIKAQWDDKEKCYYIRCKAEFAGFTDEFHAKFKPDKFKECLGDGEFTLLRDTSDCGEPLNVPKRITAQQLLSLMLTGGY